MNISKPNISNKTVAYNGAIIAIAAVFAYSLIVMMYVLIRSSATIYSIMETGERTTILLVSGFSAAYSVAVFSLVMAAFSSIIGLMTAVILKKCLLCFNTRFDFRKAILISGITASAILTVIYLLLYSLLGNWMTFNYIETLSFWFLFPAAVFFTACLIGGGKLNKILNTGLLN
jgi:hypothetical protein